MGSQIEHQAGSVPAAAPAVQLAARVKARGQAAREAYRASLAPHTEAEARLVADQILLVRESSANYAFILPAVGAIIVLYNIGLVSWPRMLAWWLVVTTVCVGAETLGRGSVKHPPAPVPRDVARAAQMFTALTGVITVLWAGMIPVMWVSGNFLQHIMILMLVASSLSSSSSVNAPHYASARLSIWIYGATLLCGAWFIGPTLYLPGLALVGLFVLSMSAMSRANFERTRRMLRLEEERGSLIDDLKTAMTEADRARAHAEAASRAKSQFLANMSHELRTPMNAILGFSEIIETGGSVIKPEKQVEYAGLIRRSGQHLLMLINDVLDLSKIEAGGIELQEREVDTGRLIADCMNLMEPRAAAGAVTLTADLAPGFPDLRGDVRALKQILLNLMSNAVKFTPAGGTVSVFARRGGAGELLLGVADSGVGIAEEDQARIFENFGQGRHDVVRPDDKGTGLGLPIVKGLVEAHGGRVELVSCAGKGTCVTVHLPASRAASQAFRVAS